MTDTKTTDYSPHPAANLFPLMAEEELQKLAADIKANGLHEPILLYEGQILDGRNRLAACRLAGVEPRYAPAQLNGSNSPTLFVISMNLHRRHLTHAERATIGVEMLPLLSEEARERQRKAGRDFGNNHTKEKLAADLPQATSPNVSNAKPDRRRDLDARELAGKAVGVGGRTIQKALLVKRRDPVAYEQLKAGKSTVEAEEMKVRRKLDRPTAPLPPPPPKPAVGRDERREKAAKRWMIEGLSQVRGLCRGLSEMSIDRLAHALDEEERKTWIGIASTAAHQLRDFARKLREAS